VVTILVVLLAAGCVSSPQKGSSNQSVPVNESHTNVRYVQLNFLDGTSSGGKYVSETPAFTTIVWMYTIDPGATTMIVSSNLSGPTYVKVKDPDRYLVVGNGNNVSFKNTLINTMIDIGDPTAMIEKTLQEFRDIRATDKFGLEKRGWPAT
jgi:hypothetical protein